jgi:hypothetical protein
MKFSMGFLGTSPMQISLFKEYILVTNVVANTTTNKYSLNLKQFHPQQFCLAA